jgi:predicted transcriptional regulator of viral defense system
MERKLKPIFVQRFLQENGLQLFTPHDFQHLFGVTLRAAQEFIKDHQEDIFLKIRNGLYSLISYPAKEEIIANRLYPPSYISFEYAMSYYGIIPELVYAVTSATTRITREFTVNNKLYTYSRIKKQAYRGYKRGKMEGTTVFIANPEKALADYLYFVDLGRKKLNERLMIRDIRKKELIKYAKLFDRKSLTRLAREI